MRGDDVVGLISTLALAIAEDKSIEQIQLYIIIFRQLSETLESIAEHRAVLQGLTQNIVDENLLDTFID